MRGFLRFIGIIEIIGYILGIILWFIYLPFSGWNILYFFIYLIFAPAFACVCFTCANLIDKNEALEKRVRNLEKINGVVINTENVKTTDEEGYLIIQNANELTGYSVAELLDDYQDDKGHKFKKGSTGLLINSGLNEGEIEFQTITGKNIVVKIEKTKFERK